MKAREDCWIAAKDSHTNGYNMTPTGYSTRGYRFTDEQRMRVSQAVLHASATQEVRRTLCLLILLALEVIALVHTIWRGQPSPFMAVARQLLEKMYDDGVIPFDTYDEWLIMFDSSPSMAQSLRIEPLTHAERPEPNIPVINRKVTRL